METRLGRIRVVVAALTCLAAGSGCFRRGGTVVDGSADAGPADVAAPGDVSSIEDGPSVEGGPPDTGPDPDLAPSPPDRNVSPVDVVGAVDATDGSAAPPGNADAASKKALGATCAGADECLSGICGGRCCAQACNCSVQSSANLVSNAGFDKDLAGWSRASSTPGGGPTWTDFDATSCPFSGSVTLNTPAVPSPPAVATVQQCVRLKGNTLLNIGFRGYLSPQAALGPGSVGCEFYWFSHDACEGGAFGTGNGERFFTGRGVWHTAVFEAVAVPATAVSLLVECGVYSSGMNQATLGYIDMVHVTPAAGRF